MCLCYSTGTNGGVFLKALKDPELVAEAQKGQWVIEPVPGEELQSLADQFMVPPPQV
jgi:hypothetical protein